MKTAGGSFDIVVCGGRVVDPAAGRDGIFDVGVRGGRVREIGEKLASGPTTMVVDASGSVVVPGLIDLHAHVFGWATGYGLDVDDVGVNAGVTTVVDMGS